MATSKKHISILGSTGSIGTQALDVVRANPHLFEIDALTAGNNADLLIAQAAEFKPNTVVIGNEKLYDKVFAALDPLHIKVYAGEKSIAAITEMSSTEIIITAMVGYAGLLPTLRAIEAGKNIALANKETLVVAGDLVTQLARQKGVNIYPVDSEHSAIFQCLVGEFHNPVEKLILTASGGPFRGKKRHELEKVTKAQALKHPNWDMGAKITIDSASLMNKGLEVIEAKWLFNVNADKIEVVVHPQSIIHSMVMFTDGSIKAQMGLPDMKLPIQYALCYPERISSDFPRYQFSPLQDLTFEQPDIDTFRNLSLAYQALQKGGNAPCILNAANEVAVKAFLEDRISFLEMSDMIAYALEHTPFERQPDLQNYIATDEAARRIANEWGSAVKEI